MALFFSAQSTDDVPSDWEQVCARRKRVQLESIPPEWIIKPIPETQLNVMDVPRQCGLLSAAELEITETVDVQVILDKLRLGTWSSVQVTTATNCLTEIFVDRALERARFLDDHLARTGKVVGPLHGLPISLKGQISAENVSRVNILPDHRYIGYAKWIGRVAESDCVLVEILYECGAVPFVRTNVPQTLMWGETMNHVFGRTLNPYNLAFTPGGSSGGEGAANCHEREVPSVSLRIPSAFCGLYTLRPSYERLPYHGAVNALEGQESISSVLGPMSNSISGVKIFTKAILDAEPWLKDPLVLRKGWSESEYRLDRHGGGENLCFAIMWDNGVVKPHPPLRRAMEMTKKALEAAGHKVIDWEPHRHLEIYKNAETIFAADGGHDYRQQTQGVEPLIQTMSPSTTSHASALDGPLVKSLVGELYHREAYDLWQLHTEKRELRKSHLDHWQATVSRTGTGRPVDAIISPAVAYTAVPHGLNTDSFYTTLCNALDYSCSVFPVTFVDPDLDDPHPPHRFYNHEDEHIYNFYDSDLFPGCPVALQLIGGTQEEEAVIGMTEIVVAALEKLVQ
ncbi:general amidase [Roridomyces roridus]|uniref:General amidase n=1 Tax=Roridomyces roridus TaxID=1738132 RepID=A0AAD7CBB5_9AGAR|nr:general amidase [Roridomyces roridus]